MMIDDPPMIDQTVVTPPDQVSKQDEVVPAVTVPRTGYQACLPTGIGLVMISE
jgi:hypothetical protein